MIQFLLICFRKDQTPARASSDATEEPIATSPNATTVLETSRSFP